MKACDPREQFAELARLPDAKIDTAVAALWIAAEDSHIPRWLEGHPEGEGATDSLAGVRARLAHVPSAGRTTPADCADGACRPWPPVKADLPR